MKKSIKEKDEEKPEIKKKLNKEDLLMQNFITLQKVLVNLSVKVDALTEQISKLLALFEISAKSFAQREGTSLDKGDKDFLEKLDQLIEQNKIIAKGITLIDEKNRELKPRFIPRRI